MKDDRSRILSVKYSVFMKNWGNTCEGIPPVVSSGSTRSIIIMCIQKCTVHDQYIKYSSKVSILNNAPMIQTRMAGAVLFDKMDLDIIIGSVCLRMDLIPNAFFH